MRIAAGLGADVPFFLADGPQLGSGDGSELEPLDLPQDFWVVVLLPHGAAKTSTADVYAAFDARKDVAGFAERRQALLDGLARVERPRRSRGRCRRTTSRARRSRTRFARREPSAQTSPEPGRPLYGLFHHRREAEAARRALRRLGRTWIAAPAWYG